MTAVLLCLSAVLLLAPGDVGATNDETAVRGAFEGVFYRPTGSPVAFAWKTGSKVDCGEWRIYRGHDLASFGFVDSTPARVGITSYRWRASRPLIDREYFQLRYRAADGSETVLATVLLVGTEISTVMQSLPGGPPAALSMLAPGWEPPDLTFDLNPPAGVVLLKDRPEPAVPPPRIGC